MPRTHFGWFLGNFKFSSFERANIPGIDLRALPLLIKALESRDTSLDNAYQLLWNKSPQVVQARLAKPVPAVEIRANAAMILAQMEEGARPAIPALVRVLKSDSSDVVRYNAATCLLAIGTGNPTARAALIEVSINDSSAEVRLLAGGVFRPLPIEGDVFPFQPRAEDAPLFVPR
jgi:HEAT repeat protein